MRFAEKSFIVIIGGGGAFPSSQNFPYRGVGCTYSMAGEHCACSELSFTSYPWCKKHTTAGSPLSHPPSHAPSTHPFCPVPSLFAFSFPWLLPRSVACSPLCACTIPLKWKAYLSLLYRKMIKHVLEQNPGTENRFWDNAPVVQMRFGHAALVKQV